MTELPAGTNAVTGQIVDAAIAVHSALGPGMLESVYEQCLAYELTLRDIQVERQVHLPIHYKQMVVDKGLRIDLVVGNLAIVEIKSIDRLAPIHEAQLLTYLKLSSFKVGLLINFNVLSVRDGIKRLVWAR